MTPLKIIQITPGAAGMFCGGCLRDNALVGALRSLGIQVLLVPLYTPLHLDEADQSRGTPVFFGGVNVYLEQKFAWFRRLPAWTRRWLDSPVLLNAVSVFAAKTNPTDLGDLTVSMLKGSDGFQAGELDQLLDWLKTQEKPDVICLSNILLGGLAERLKSELGVPVGSYLQGEDYFLDGLPANHRAEAWALARKCAGQFDFLVAPSAFFADTMAHRLGLAREKITVIHNGINLEGYALAAERPAVPTLGYFARMCPEKGLRLLIEAFLVLKSRPRWRDLRLKVGGSCTGIDEAFVEEIKALLSRTGHLPSVAFSPNVDRQGKIAFLQSLSVFCTPATYGEAFGLYILEALACGVPFVAPNVAAFPEILERTGGGVIAQARAEALADEIEVLLEQPSRSQQLGNAGRNAVIQHFSIERMARDTAAFFRTVVRTSP